MKHHSVAVVGVLHPGVSRYLDSYLDSLETQTFKEFDLVLVNDGLSNVKTRLGKYGLNTSVISIRGTPSAIRRGLIDVVLGAGYEYIIFTDCDDYFSSNRLEVCLFLLERSHVVVNDLDIVSAEGITQHHSYFSSRIEDGKLIEIDDILHCNLMGLTNTSVRREVLTECLPFLNADVVTFDWLLWSHAILSGNRVEFTTRTSTKYRVYSGNIAGLPQKIDALTVFSGISVKAAHYKLLLSHGVSYRSLNLAFARAQEMSRDQGWLKEYVVALREARTDNPMWWENIKILDQFRMS